MTKKHRIPGRLFVEAGRSVEEALRRDTSEAIAQFRRDGDLIATWEDDKVVLLHDPKSSPVVFSKTADAPAPLTLTTEQAAAECKLRFLELVAGMASKIYMSGERLYVEFPRAEKEVGDFLSAEENQDILRDFCRELAGREMTVYLLFVGETTAALNSFLSPALVRLLPPWLSHLDHGTFITDHLRAIVALLRAAGDSPRAAQVEKILARRSARQPPNPPGFFTRRVVDVPPGLLRRHRTMHEEGDPDPSHKSGE